MKVIDKGYITTVLLEQKGILDKLFVEVKKKLNLNEDNDIFKGFKKMDENIKKINELVNVREYDQFFDSPSYP